MSLCLVNIHGDIEGDYEIIRDLPNGFSVMEEGQLKQIRDFIVNYIMRDSYVMYSDEARDVGPHHIDLMQCDYCKMKKECHVRVSDTCRTMWLEYLKGGKYGKKEDIKE